MTTGTDDGQDTHSADVPGPGRPAPGDVTGHRRWWAALRDWPPRRWIVAGLAAAVTVVVIAVPTDLIDTALFMRDVPVTWWAWPALIATAVLAGMVVATYVRSPAPAVRRDRAGKWGTAGGVLSFFAVGCPVCNKLVLLALGTSGALSYFQPVQPLLALISIGALAWALATRLRRENACVVLPAASQ